MKKWIIRLICLLFAIGSCVQMFVLKYRVIEKEDELKALHAQIFADSRALHMLEAEWAVKNNPDRLYQMVVDQPRLEPIGADQLRTWESLPAKFVPPPETKPDLITDEEDE